jgi:hypothetical protein
VDSRVGLDNTEKRKFFTLLGLERRPLGRPARSQSLYRLRFPGLIEALSRCLFGGAGNTVRNMSQDIRCPGRDSKRGPSEYESYF